MQLYERLGVPCGVTAVIGSGGKTTLLSALSRELPGTVILTTTTHILPFEGVPLLTAPTEDEVRAALARSRVLCLGTPAPESKLTAPSLPFSLLEQLADYVLVEADGSRRLPSRRTRRTSRSFRRRQAACFASSAHTALTARSAKPCTVPSNSVP